MAKSDFPAPKYNQIIEPNSDKQIISVPLDQVDWGARKPSQREGDGGKHNGLPSGYMRIKHVG